MAFKRHLVAALALAAAAFLALSAPLRAETLEIVGFGDSLMAGYGLGPGESFPEKLERALRERGHDVVIANAGVSGDTTSGGLSRLDWSVPDGTAIVILELGGNDMLRGVPPEVTRRNLAAMVERLKARDITVLLAGMMAAPSMGAGYRDDFDRIYPELAAEHEVAFYPFFMEGVAAEDRYLLADGIHPNAEGVDVMVANFLPAIERLISAGSSGS